MAHHVGGDPGGGSVPSLCLSKDCYPTQDVMGQGNQECHREDFGEPSDRELGHAVLAHLGIYPFGRGAPLPIHRFCLLRGHALPPPHYLLAVSDFGTLRSFRVGGYLTPPKESSPTPISSIIQSQKESHFC